MLRAIVVLFTAAGLLFITLGMCGCPLPGVCGCGTPDCNDNCTPEEVIKLTASDAAWGDGFGFSAAVSGDTAVIGAPEDEDAGSASGSAYVFTRDEAGLWTQQAKLTASDAAAWDEFGISVAASGDTAVIGAHNDDDAGSWSGSAYVFVRSGGAWAQQAKLTASDAAEGDQFGISVAVGGNTAVIGAHNDDDGGGDSGSVYVFVRDEAGSWTEQAKLTASDAAAGDWFGISVAVGAETAIIGADMDDDAGYASGSAYVFVRDEAGLWTQQAKLTPSDAAEAYFFGNSVAASGDTVVIGARSDDHAGYESGSAYVFTRDAFGLWTERAKLTASDAVANGFFGYSVALSDNTAVIGAIGAGDGGSPVGSSYMFDLSSCPP